MKTVKLFVILAICLYSQMVYSKGKDTLHVTPYYKTLIQTDPSRGVNEVKTWAVFPPKTVPYRKITAFLTFQCPDSMKCGSWDYVDYVIVRRKGSAEATSLDQEIVRMLTPYGGYFDNKWQFTWQQDVTDWGCILHDSVEIEYQHTGYETTDKGWLVTLDFEIVTGKPIMEPLGYENLWKGTFAYGDTNRMFETLVTSKIVNIPAEAKQINLRVAQTGHGMDRPDNCSEFCSKWRQLYFDKTQLEHKQLFIVCGNNPLYPQAGTWVFSRANWCPGSLAIPDIYTLPVTQNKHTFDLKMESYISENPSGGWNINGNVFFYKQPSAKNDISLEEIIAPSKQDMHGRMNPICASPHIRIKNNGSANLTSATIEYGMRGQKKQKFHWKGNLSFLQETEVMLPGVLDVKLENDLFEVMLLNPNGKTDEYKADNYQFSETTIVPAYKQKMIVAMYTNQDSVQTSWFICNAAADTVYQRKGKDLKPSTLYNDTLFFEEGCYQLQVNDSANDGLSFWANPEGGYGYIRLLNENGETIKIFNPDFGTSIQHSFTINKNASAKPQTMFVLSPTVTDGLLLADIVIEKPQNITLAFSDEKETLCWENKLYNFSSQFLKLDISHLKKGIYKVKLTLEDGKTSTKLVKRK